MAIDCSRAFDRGKNVQRNAKEPEEGGGEGEKEEKEGRGGGKG